MSEQLLFNCPVNGPRRNVLDILLSRPVLGFFNQLFNLSETGRHLFLVGNEPRRIIYNPGNARCIEMSYLAFFAAAGDERGETVHIVFGAVYLPVEIGFYAAYLPEVLI